MAVVYKICAAGDCGTSSPEWTNCADKIKDQRPDKVFILGDTYPVLNATTITFYNRLVTGNSGAGAPPIAKADVEWVPGNHDNGDGSAGQPDLGQAFTWNGAGNGINDATNGWDDSQVPYKAFLPGSLIHNTDRFRDWPSAVHPNRWRFFILNDGAIVSTHGKESWPGFYGDTAMPTEAQIASGATWQARRVKWLRDHWIADKRNVMVIHHNYWSPGGSHPDLTGNRNVIREMLGLNDNSGIHSDFYLNGHSHVCQIVKRRNVSGTIVADTVDGVHEIGIRSSPIDTTIYAGQAGNLQFLGAQAGFGLIEILDSPDEIRFTMLDQNGNPASNTGGITGSNQVIYLPSGSPPPPPVPSTPVITQPAAGATVSGQITVAWSASTGGTAPLTYQIDRGDGVFIDKGGALSDLFTYPTGARTIRVRARDSAGVFSGIATRSFTVGTITQGGGVSQWLYAAPNYDGCIFGIAPTSRAIPQGEAFVGNTRKFWLTDHGGEAALGGKGPWFNPDARDESGNTFLYPGGTAQAVPWTISDLIADAAGTGGNSSHVVDAVSHVLGARNADPSWPGHAAITAWTYGDGSYVDQCVNKWANLMLQVQRRTLFRMWHEMGNAIEGTSPNWALFIANWRKVCIRFRQLGALASEKGQIVWCPASHPTNPSSDVDRFPGTYPSQPGGCDWIGRDEYIDSLSTWEDAGQAWYDEFNPTNGPSNVDKVPLIICESGADSGDPNRIAKLNHLFDLLKTSWSDISAWIWWNGAGNDLIDTPAGFQAAFRNGVNDPYFLPDNLINVTPTGPSAPVITSPAEGASFNQASVTVAWNASSGGTAPLHYEISRDGGATFVNVGTALSNTFSYPDGQATVHVKAVDNAGVSSPVAIRHFNVSTQVAPPSAPVITAPASGSVQSSQTVTVKWNASIGGTGALKYLFSADGGVTFTDKGTALSDTRTYLDGPHTVVVKAVDSANVASPNSSRSFTVTTVVQPPSGVQPVDWQESGKEGGGFTNLVIIDPGNNQRMFACGDENGTPRSVDGGRTWQVSNEGRWNVYDHQVASGLWDPRGGAFADTCYILTGNGAQGGFWRSQDAGQTWQLMSTVPVGFGNHSSSDADPDPQPRSAGKLIVMDAAKGFMYVGTYTGGVMRASLSDLTKWTTIGLKGYYVRSLISDGGGRLFAATLTLGGSSGHVYRCQSPSTAAATTTAPGAAWQSLSAGPLNCEELDLVNGQLFAVVGVSQQAGGTFNGWDTNANSAVWLFPAVNGPNTSAGIVAAGSAWKKLAAPAGNLWMGIDAYYNPANGRTTVFAACQPVAGASGGQAAQATYRGISTDGFQANQTWAAMPTAETRNVNDVGGPNATPRPFWQTVKRMDTGMWVVIDPTDATIVWANPMWRAAAALGAQDTVTFYPWNRKLMVSTNRGVLVDRDNPDIVHMADTDHIYTRTQNAESGFNVVQDTLPGADTTGYSLAADHNHQDTGGPNGVFCGTGNVGPNTNGKIHWNPDPAGQGDWTDVTPAAMVGRCVGLVVMKDSQNRDVVIAAEQAGSVWRAVVNRAGTFTWARGSESPASVLLTDGTSQAAKRSPLAWRPGSKFVYLLDRNSGVWRSADAGVSWTRIFQVTQSADSQGYIDVDPADDTKIYVSTTTQVLRLDNATTTPSAVVLSGAGLSRPGPMKIDRINRVLYVFNLPAQGQPAAFYGISTATAATATSPPTFTNLTTAKVRAMAVWPEDLDAHAGRLYLGSHSFGVMRGVAQQATQNSGPPLVTITAPPSQVSSRTVTVKATATDPDGVTDVRVSVDGGAEQAMQPTAGAIGADWTPAGTGAWLLANVNLTASDADWATREGQLGRTFHGKMKYKAIDTTSIAEMGGYLFASVAYPTAGTMPFSGMNTIPAVNAGTLDANIRAFANAVKAITPTRVFVRLFWEHNLAANRFNPANYVDGSGAAAPGTWADFISAWQRVWTIFFGNQAAYTALGISGTPVLCSPSQVKFAYNPNKRAGSGVVDPTLGYPGASYVDWIFLDSYPSRVSGGSQVMESFSTLVTHPSVATFTDFYATFSAYGKPLGIGEMSVHPVDDPAGPYGSGITPLTRVNWWSQIVNALQTQFPLIRLFTTFDANDAGGQTWKTDAASSTSGDSGAQALAAYKAFATDPYMQPASGGASNEWAKTVTLPTPTGGGGTQVGTVAADGKGTAGTTVAAPKPAGVVSGQQMLAAVSLVGADTVTSVPTGWTVVSGSPGQVGTGSGTKVFQAVYQKTAGGSEPSTYSFGATGATSIQVSIVAVPSGYSVVTANVAKSAAGARDILAVAPTGNSLQPGDELVTFAASTMGPRPWPDTGVLLGFMPSESTGDIVDSGGIHRLEGLTGREIALGHSMYPWAAGNAVFPEAGGSALGATSDWEDGRLSYISWPSQRTWPGGENATIGKPSDHLGNIAKGQYDQLIYNWAAKLKAWGQPVPFRLMWELNGGDPPWAAGHEPAASIQTWLAAWLAAVKRIYLIFKGTDSQMTQLTSGFYPGAAAYTVNNGKSAGALNVQFIWNPQEFESSSLSRDVMWPGNAFEDFAATELYLSPGNTATEMVTNTGGGGFGGVAHKALYQEYAVNRGKLLATGEGGDRWQGSADTTACISRVQSYVPMFSSRPNYKIFCWWDGGSTTGMGQSELAGKPSNLRTAENAFFNDASMLPELTKTFADQVGTAAFTELFQGRAPVGHAKTNYGVGQLGQIALHRLIPAGVTSQPSPPLQGFGFGEWVAVSVQLRSSIAQVSEQHTIVVSATDAHANPLVGADTQIVTVNLTGANAGAPVVTFLSPPTSVSARVQTVSVTATDPDGISTVEVSVNGGAYQPMTLIGQDQYSRTVTLNGSTGGTANTIDVRATDAHPSPQTSTPVTRTVTVTTAASNAGAPAVAITQPDPAETLTDTSVSLVATASDPDGIATVEYQVGGTGGAWHAMAATGNPDEYGAQITLPGTAGTPVTTSVFVRATDAHPSPQTSTPVSASFTVNLSGANTSPPVVTLLSPPRIVTDQSVPILVDAEDPDGVALVEVRVDGGEWIQVPVLPGT